MSHVLSFSQVTVCLSSFWRAKEASKAKVRHRGERKLSFDKIHQLNDKRAALPRRQIAVTIERLASTRERERQRQRERKRIAALRRFFFPQPTTTNNKSIFRFFDEYSDSSCCCCRRNWGAAPPFLACWPQR